MTRTRRTVAAALLTAAAAGGALAQTPAAKLLPARPVDGATVARGYAPEPGTFGDTKPPATTTKPAAEPRSWTGAPLTPTPPPEPRRPPVQQPQAPAYAQGASGVYAGPPAYRWYGYGTTTPGANPLAPTGQYPRGSANWYAQTGATPGAFPVPVTAGGDQLPRFEPPAYASVPQPVEPPASYVQPPATQPTLLAMPRPVPSFNPPVAPQPLVPASAPLPVPVPAITPPSPVITMPAPVMPTAPELVRSTGELKPLAVSSTTTVEPPPVVMKPVKVEPPAPPPAGGLSWQTSAGPAEAVAFTTAKPLATSAPPAANPVTFTAAKPVEPVTPPPPVATPVTPPPVVEAAPLTFKPSLPPPVVPTFTPTPGANPAAPLPPALLPPVADWKSTPQARGQQPTADAVSLTSQVRNACYGLATVSEVTYTGPTTLTVRLAAASDADARSAAANIAKVPTLRPYAVRFVVELSGR